MSSEVASTSAAQQQQQNGGVANGGASNAPGSASGAGKAGPMPGLAPHVVQMVSNLTQSQIQQMIQRYNDMRAKGETQSPEYIRTLQVLQAVQHVTQLKQAQAQTMAARAQQEQQTSQSSAATASPNASAAASSSAPANGQDAAASSTPAQASASSSAPNVANGITAAVNAAAATSAPASTNGKAAVAAAAPSPAATTAPTPTHLSQEHMLMLRAQMQAYKLLTRQVPLPPQLQAALLAPNKALDELKMQIPDLSALGAAGEVAKAAAESHTAARIAQATRDGEPAANEVGPDGKKKELDADAVAKITRRVMPEHDPKSKIYPYNAYAQPFSILAKPVLGQGQYAATQQQRVIVPSLMPAGLDIDQLIDERNRFVKARVNQRISELESLPSTMSQKPPLSSLENEAESPMGLKERAFEVNKEGKYNANAKVKALIELKSLYLLEKQKAMREQIVRSMSHASTLALDRTAFRRFKKQTLRDARITDQLERKQRIDREKRARQKHVDYLNTICNHGRELLAAHRNAQSTAQRLGRAVLKLHADTEREEQKRIERIAKERLNALKADDEEAYLKLIDTAKDTRIAHLLRQTDVYLDNLAQAVQAQQNDDVHAEAIAADRAGLPPPTTADNTNANQEIGVAVDETMFGAQRQDDPSEDSGKVDYYSVAHRITEKISEQPSILVGGTLKHYQIKGLQWMVSLFNNRLNGILADEMGLGKTIQTISLITFLIEAKKQPAPYLVIVPLSTLTNWVNEFGKWAPNVSVLVYKGAPPARKALASRIRQGGWQVLLTTYEYVIKDKHILGKIKWIHMIIDEGHRMKNAGSKLAITLTSHYITRYRLLLTGTPLQNSLPELWALLNFVLPKIFNSVKSFDEWFNTPFANAGGADGSMQLNEEEQLLIIKRLHKVLRPFLLRRLKKDVESELPDKVEKVVKCRKSALQAKLYHQMITHKTFFTGEELGKSGKKAGGIRGLQNALMQLRKICNHPYVFEQVEMAINPTKENGPDLYRVSGKFELLDRVLPKFKATGHRVLMFFQMTAIMDIMEDYLRYRDHKYLRLDGSTKPDDRTVMLHEFNKPNSEYFMFILSTRAGGLGLNLQTADTVVIFDSDWNPHQDLQAQDRAHRIGQKVEVRVLRLITEKSVEEKMLEIAHRKLDMDGKVIQAGRFDNQANAEERDAMLRAMLEAGDDEEEDDSGELTNEELNQIIARSEDEEKLFNKIDADRDREELAAWRAAGNKGKAVDRLITEDELPAHFQQSFEDEFMANEDKEDELVQRKRAVVHYNDNLTEEQFLAALENNQDITEVMEEKRERAERRRLKVLAKEQGGSATPEPSKKGRKGNKSRDDTPDGSPAPGRKRKRTADAETPDPEDEGRSATKKRKSGPDADMREAVSQALQTCYKAIENDVEEETGRKRCAIFLDLPKAADYPDYRIIIAKPICMRQIKRRIDNRTYRDVKSCKDDIHLMFDNARTYNQEGSWVWNDANILQQVWDTKHDEITRGSGLPGSEGEDGIASIASAGPSTRPATADTSAQDDDDDDDTPGGSSRATPASGAGGGSKPPGSLRVKLTMGKKKAIPQQDMDEDEY